METGSKGSVHSGLSRRKRRGGNGEGGVQGMLTCPGLPGTQRNGGRDRVGADYSRVKAELPEGWGRRNDRR